MDPYPPGTDRNLYTHGNLYPNINAYSVRNTLSNGNLHRDAPTDGYADIDLYAIGNADDHQYAPADEHIYCDSYLYINFHANIHLDPNQHFRAANQHAQPNTGHTQCDLYSYE
jgi:hypothetical protein